MQTMTTNDAIIRYNFISKVAFKDGDATLSKELKIKVMSMRIEFGKINKVFEEDVQEFTKGILEDRFNELQNKPERTDEENKEFNDLINKYNGETNEYINKRALDPVEVNEYELSEDEFAEIMETNAEKDITINGQTLNAPDFLEAIHDLFVK